MINLPPPLVMTDELSAASRWRLVASLYAQARSLIVGSLGQIIVVAVCWWRTGWWGYGVLLGAMLAILSFRLHQRSRFQLRADRTRTAGWSPEHWARRFTVGGCLTGGLWAVTTGFTCLLFDDPPLQMLVVMIQAGWLSGACVRNAASPSAVAAQALTTSLPGFVVTLLCHSSFMHLVAPFFLLQLSPTFSTSRYLAGQLSSLLFSEERLEAANVRLEMLSATDGLTGVGNRRAFDATLQIEWARALREGKELALLIIDVDYFKRFNDRYGHQAGDSCLRHIAQTMQAKLRRPPDFAGRFGGEEFVCLLPGTNEDGARDVAERVRGGVMTPELEHEASPFHVVTISIGVASLVPQPGMESQELIRLADQALYEAKETGRNRVCQAGDSFCAMRLGQG